MSRCLQSFSSGSSLYYYIHSKWSVSLTLIETVAVVFLSGHVTHSACIFDYTYVAKPYLECASPPEINNDTVTSVSKATLRQYISSNVKLSIPMTMYSVA